MKNSGAFIVSWDFSNGKDNEVLLVGHKQDNVIEVISAFQGEEAIEIYNKLAGVEKSGDS